jgi:hypothetical protein
VGDDLVHLVTIINLCKQGGQLVTVVYQDPSFHAAIAPGRCSRFWKWLQAFWDNICNCKTVWESIQGDWRVKVHRIIPELLTDRAVDNTQYGYVNIAADVKGHPITSKVGGDGGDDLESQVPDLGADIKTAMNPGPFLHMK